MLSFTAFFQSNGIYFLQANIDYQYLVNFVYLKIKFFNFLRSVFIKIVYICKLGCKITPILL